MPTTWSMHDAGFFSLELPPGWTVEQPNTGTILLQERSASAAKGDLVLTLMAVSRAQPGGLLRNPNPPPRPKPTPLDAQAELQKWLYAQKHVAVRQAPRLLSGTAYPTAATEGLQQMHTGAPAAPPRLPWYKRLFQRRPLMAWRYWAVMNSHLLVLVSCNGKPAAVEKHRRLVDRIVHSLHLPDRDLLVGRTFTETVVSLARTWFPQTSVAILDDVHLQFGSQNVSLVNLHRHYLASPQDLPRQVRAFLAAVQGDMPASSVAGSWAHARERILPIFLTTMALNNAKGRILYEEWVNGLSIAYILEEEPAFETVAATPKNSKGLLDPGERAITRDDIARWNVSAEELHTQALHNLVLFSHEHTMQGQKGEGYTMLCLGGASESAGSLGGGDRHNAVRVLLPELHRKLREHLGATFYAALPTRDLLIAFSITDEDVLDRVREQVAEDHAKAGPAGLSPKLFLVTPDGIAGDPHEEEDYRL